MKDGYMICTCGHTYHDHTVFSPEREQCVWCACDEFIAAKLPQGEG